MKDDNSEKILKDTDDKKVSDAEVAKEKKSDAEVAEEKKSDVEVADKKNSDAEAEEDKTVSEFEKDKKVSFDDDDTKIIDTLNGKKTWKEKIMSPFETLSELWEELSWKYIAAVASGVLFCIFVVGAVLIFAEDPYSDNGERKFTERNFEDMPVEDRIHVKITAGMTTGEIASQLEEKGVIDSSLKFRILSRLRGYDDKMKLGTYTFTANMEDEEVFEIILNGRKHEVTFTIPEGFGVRDIAERLYGIDLADKKDFLKAAQNFAPYDYMKKRKNVIYSAEGFLFPDTYTVESDISVEEILKMMAENFDYRINQDIRDRAQEKNLSLYDLVILASLIEKEVRYDEDRAIVAQVFLKRLQLNMPLQTDASLQYLMNAPKEDVSIEDTKIDSPYNTYQYAGLPPGPIANPGMESIEAVLNPADTDYLYFVADRQGHNHYSDTYDEHLELVKRYR